MARPAACICKRFARLGDEAPVIAVGVQGQGEDAESVIIADFTVRQDRREAIVVPPSRSHHELTQAMRGVSPTIWVLRRKALVVVVVSIEHDLRATLIQVLPERVVRRI
jgi:hypothetical protein